MCPSLATAHATTPGSVELPQAHRNAPAATATAPNSRHVRGVTRTDGCHPDTSPVPAGARRRRGVRGPAPDGITYPEILADLFDRLPSTLCDRLPAHEQCVTVGDVLSRGWQPGREAACSQEIDGCTFKEEWAVEIET